MLGMARDNLFTLRRSKTLEMYVVPLKTEEHYLSSAMGGMCFRLPGAGHFRPAMPCHATKGVVAICCC